MESEPSNLITLDIFNSSPDTVSIIALSDSTIINLSTGDLLSDATFIWTPSNDLDNQSVYYKIKLCDTMIKNEQRCVVLDTNITATIFSLQNISLINLLDISNSDNQISWTVYAHDGVDSTGITNQLFINLDWLTLDLEEIPKNLSLSQNYPNPFNPNTSINFNLEQETYIELSIYDISGSKVKTLYRGTQSPGLSSMNWNARDNLGKKVSAGIYFYKLESTQFSKTMKMILLK